jgi:hypothetical protein
MHAPPTALWLPLLAGDAPPPPLCPGLPPANPAVAAFRNHFLPLTYIAAVLYRARPGAPWTLARPRRPALLRPAPLFDTAPAWPPLLDLFRLNTRQAPPRLPMANPSRWGSGLTVTPGCPCCGDGALMVMLLCWSTLRPRRRLDGVAHATPVSSRPLLHGYCELKLLCLSTVMTINWWLCARVWWLGCGLKLLLLIKCLLWWCGHSSLGLSPICTMMPQFGWCN